MAATESAELAAGLPLLLESVSKLAPSYAVFVWVLESVMALLWMWVLVPSPFQSVASADWHMRPVATGTKG